MRKFRAIRQLARALRLVWESSPRWMVALLCLVLVQSVLPLGSLYIFKLLVDRLVAHSTGAIDTGIPVFYLLGGLAVVTIATVVCRSLTTIVHEHQAFRVSDRMQRLIHEKSTTVPLEFYEKAELRDTLHRAQVEAPSRPLRIVLALTQVVQNSIALLSLGGLIALTGGGWIAGIAAVIALPGLWLRMRHSRRLFDWQRSQSENERRSEFFHWILTGATYAKELRLFGLGRLFIERAAKLREMLHRARLHFTVARATSDGAIQLLAALAVIGAFAWMVGETFRGALTVGVLVMQYQAFQRGLGLIHDLIGGAAALHENQLFLTRVDELLAIAPDGPHRGPRPAVPRRIQHGICFENVSFAYEGGEKILDNVSFSLAPGEMVALVGENGAGKSTLVKLLCRLYDPTEGRITIDGVDLRDFERSELWRLFGVLFQDYNHYYTTAGENIWFGDITLDPDRAGLSRAAEMAGADEVIEQLPNGFDQNLGRMFAGGEELSIGQWQKLALARTFFRDAQVVILDEPSSALDVKTEHEVFERFKDLTRGRTSFVISHRLSTVRMADRILVLGSGRLTEIGSHDELMMQGGAYAELFETQASSYR